MQNYTYSIVGGGMTAAAAVTGIREVDDKGSIGVIGAEPHPPYDRPPLSKGLWKDKPIESIWRKIDAQSLTFHLGRTARELDPRNKRVIDDQGTVYTFSKLLLATGCTPRRLPFGGEQIIYFRTLDDYERLRGLTGHGDRFAVIGGGFIGSEVAAALAMNGKKVVLIFPDEAIGSRIYPAELAKFLVALYREKGVEVLAGATVTGCESRQGTSVLKIRDAQTNGERKVIADGVIAGIGVQPNVELAQRAGLDVDHGIRVDATLRTNQPDIYAAGFHSPAMNQWLRVEHEDNANTMGRFAGVSMAGRAISYDHLSFFYSDLFDMGYEAVGEVDSRLETVADWKVRCKEGVVYYLREGRVRGVLLWNVWGQVDAVRS
jgi:NADPH-dependent 2,4-dienoyl-CoA reductase/sulfur reductase-like enzyme